MKASEGTQTDLLQSDFLKSLDLKLKAFALPLIKNLEQQGLLSPQLSIDHACYRVEDLETYEAHKRALCQVADLLSEAYINGRPIATFRLHHPLLPDPAYPISLIELPAPKDSSRYAEGFEHLEVVVPDSLGNWISKFPHLRFDTSNIQHVLNPDVSLEILIGNKKNKVKFHNQSLAKVIHQEKNYLMLRPPRLAFFDFDDTLCSSKDAFIKSIHQGIETALQKKVDRAWVLQGAGTTFTEFFEKLGFKDEKEILKIFSCYQSAWENFAEEATVPTGVESLLSCLKSEAVRMEIWTARDALTTESFLNKKGLLKYFDKIHAFEPGGLSKPEATEVIRKKNQNSQCIMIGDSRTDQRAAQGLKIPFIQAGWIHRLDLTLNKQAGEHLCTTPLAALNQILKITAPPNPHPQPEDGQSQN